MWKDFDKRYLTMHFHEEPSWSSCSSMYILTLWSWSNWYQYIRPSLSRPIGWRRMVSASSSLIMFLNLRLSSNWHSQRYWKIVIKWLKRLHKCFSITVNVMCLTAELIQEQEKKKMQEFIHLHYPLPTFVQPAWNNQFKKMYFKLTFYFSVL